MTKTKEPAEWTRQYQAYLWRSAAPLDVKFEVEKNTGILLARDTEASSQLVFVGSRNGPPNTYILRVELKAVLPDRDIYLVQVDASAVSKWRSEEAFLRDADRAFSYWTEKLRMTADPGNLDTASAKAYASRLRSVIAHETELAARVEDDAPVVAIQQAVLDALRKGKSFVSASKEGIQSISFDGERFVSKHQGEYDALKVFTTDAEILKHLRLYFDWDASKDVYPHKRPELEVWQFIQQQLRS